MECTPSQDFSSFLNDRYFLKNSPLVFCYENQWGIRLFMIEFSMFLANQSVFYR